MKVKIKTTIIILSVLLSGCTIAADQQDAEDMTESFHEVEYKGHSYIVFGNHVGGTYVTYSGLTHNPDCKCQKGGEDD